MGMVAIGGDDLVAGLVCIQQSDRHGLLTNVEVKIPTNLAGPESALAGFFEETDQDHLAVILALCFRLTAQKRRYATSVRISRRTASPLPCRVLRGRHSSSLPVSRWCAGVR